MKKLNDRLSPNKVINNHGKCNFILFSYCENVQKPLIKVGKYFISETDSTKFLGLNLDTHLTSHDHIDLINSKLVKTNGVLYRLNNFFPSGQLKKKSKALIVTRLTYDIESRFEAPYFSLNRVQVSQKKIIRTIYNLSCNSHTESFFTCNYLFKIHELSILSLGVHTFKLLSNAKFSLNSDFQNYST